VSLLDYLALSLFYGTVAAALAWALEGLLRQKVSPALLGALWTLALAKFFLPFGPALPVPLVPLQAAGAVGSAPAGALAVNAAALAQGSPWPALIVALHLIAVAVLAARRAVAARKLLASIDALPLAPRELIESVRAAAAQLGLRSVPMVRLGSGPFVAGWWRPTLVVPFDRCDSPEARAVLLHELAHLRRGDQWVRALQGLAEVLFFFWPPVYWVNRRLAHYRELACDQLALAHGALSPPAYARVLVDAWRDAERRPALLAVLEMSSRSSRLERRVDMVLDLDRPRSKKWAVLAAVCGAALALTGKALAVDAPAPGADDEAPMKQFLEANQEALRRCYGAAFSGVPAPAAAPFVTTQGQPLNPWAFATPKAPAAAFNGKIVLHWTLAPTGAVGEICMTSADLTPQPPPQREQELGRCVSEVVRAWTFPKPAGGREVQVSYPFEVKVEGC
jgi:beta-lactamase regulating signal transducer with metallopeptidase domain